MAVNDIKQGNNIKQVDNTRPANETKQYKIFCINPGSTSTKVSLHINNKKIFQTSVFHDSSVLLKFPTINDQLEYRMDVVRKFIKDNHIDLHDVDAIVGRGGGCLPCPSGTYEVNDKLIDDTKHYRGGLYHSSMLGVQMAQELHKEYGGRLFMVDPPVVDELQPLARFTGVKGIWRRAVSHALNLKATARHHAKRMGKRYEDMNLIVCHIDGGISITAHRHGKMVDGNDAGGGEGPFTPTRMGSLAVTDDLMYLRRKTEKEVRDLCSQAGGLTSYFGTSDADKIHKRIEAGDKKAKAVWDAGIYQCCKWIGMMGAVLEGKVDAIVLTGGLLRFPEIEEQIKKSCGFIAPVYSYPGELEHEAMAEGAYKVLTGQEKPLIYTGKPVAEDLFE